MSIDISKLKNVKQTSKGINAQCPACYECGNDKTGDHLFVANNGRFGCITAQGKDGKEHRKRIFELVGVVHKSNIVDNFSMDGLKSGWLSKFIK